MKMSFTVPAISVNAQNNNKSIDVKIESSKFEVEYEVSEFIELLGNNKEGLATLIGFVKNDLRGVMENICEVAKNVREEKFNEDVRAWNESERRHRIMNERNK